MIAKDAYLSSMNEPTQWALVGGQGDQHLTTGAGRDPVRWFGSETARHQAGHRAAA